MKLDTISKQSIAMFISTLLLFTSIGGAVQIANQRGLDYFEQSMLVRIEALVTQVNSLQRQLECD